MKNVSPGDSTRIGWIGTGVMGLSMCGHLLAKGYAATVYSRSEGEGAARSSTRGRRGRTPPAPSRSASDVVFTMVGFPCGRAGGLPRDEQACWPLRGPPGTIVVDMTTTEPSLAKEIYEAAKARGDVHAVDAPVSGGDVGAREARLSIMVGGDAEPVAALAPAVRGDGKDDRPPGRSPGPGQHTKMCNQIVIAGTMIGVCESLLYGHKAGLDPRNDALFHPRRRRRLLGAVQPRSARS